MNDYFDKLCSKYNIDITREKLMLYKNLFADVDLVENSESYNYIKDGSGDISASITIKYGEKKDKLIDIYFHIYKSFFDGRYHLGDCRGDLYFWYNNEYYVIHDLDVDELDDESSEFRIATYSCEKVRQVQDYNKRAYRHVPVVPYMFMTCGDIEPDFDTLYTRFAPGCQTDFVEVAANMITKAKCNCSRTRTDK